MSELPDRRYDGPSDFIALSDAVRSALFDTRAARRVCERTPAAAAARAVAASMGRPGDNTYIAYLTGRMQLASRSRRQQREGVETLAGLLAVAEYRDDAAAELKSFQDACSQGRRRAGRALLEDVRIALTQKHSTSRALGAGVSAPSASSGLRTVMAVARSQPGLFALALTAGIGFGGLSMLTALVLHTAIEQIWAYTLHPIDSASEIVIPLFVASLIFGSRAGTLFVREIALAAIRRGLEDRYRRSVISHALRAPVLGPENITQRRQRATDDLMAAADVEVDAAWRSLAPMALAAGGAATILGILGTLFVADIILFGIALGLLGFLVVVNLVQIRQMRADVAEAKRLREAVIRCAHETFGQRYKSEPPTQCVEEFTKLSERLTATMVRVRRMRAAYAPVLNAMPILMAITAAFAILGPYSMSDGSPGNLTVASFLFAVLATSFPAVGAMGLELVRAPASGRGQTRQRGTDSMTYGPFVLPPRRSAGQVRLEAVNVHNDDRSHALWHTWLELPAGRVIAVVGDAGSARDTLLLLVTRSADPTTGSVWLSDHDVRALSIDSLASAIAYVPSPPYIPTGSIRDVISLGRPWVDDAAIWRALDTVGILSNIERLPEGLKTRVGYHSRENEFGRQLALAQALAGEPHILVMEYTMLELAAVKQEDTLRAITSSGITVLLATDQSDIVEAADEVIVVEAGGRLRRGVSSSNHSLGSDSRIAPAVDKEEHNGDIAANGREALRPVWYFGMCVPPTRMAPREGPVERMAAAADVVSGSRARTAAAKEFCETVGVR